MIKHKTGDSSVSCKLYSLKVEREASPPSTLRALNANPDVPDFDTRQLVKRFRFCPLLIRLAPPWSCAAASLLFLSTLLLLTTDFVIFNQCAFKLFLIALSLRLYRSIPFHCACCCSVVAVERSFP